MIWFLFIFLYLGGADERDELCPSMYSFHSSLEEKNQLLYTLTTYGIETTIDRTKKKDRIREWIQSSSIVEEEEEEEEDESEFDLDVFDSVQPENMKGRHFPEMRPQVAKVNGTKPVERKIPFAPQVCTFFLSKNKNVWDLFFFHLIVNDLFKVAEERQKIAKLANFPNGDPSLGIIQTNGLTITKQNEEKEVKEKQNDQNGSVKNKDLNNSSVRWIEVNINK